MLQKLLQIAGVSSKEEFYKKYPTEAAFFKAHPEAKQLLGKKSQQQAMMAPPQAMYGMSMAYGGYMLPQAKYGMEPQGGARPVNSDYPTYEAFKAADDNWLASQQEQANNPILPEEMQQPTSVDANGYPVSVNPNAAQTVSTAAPAASATSFKLNDYQGGSVYDFLTAQGKAGDLKTRKKLAQSLGMSNYKGTATQNAEMMEMIRQNPDILSSYDNTTAPQATIARTAAQTQNKKAVPTTAQLSNSKSVAATGKKNANWGSVPLSSSVTVFGGKNKVPYAPRNNKQIDYTGVDAESIEAAGMPGYTTFGSGSAFERIAVNQPQPYYMSAKPKYIGMKPQQRSTYDKAFSTFQKEAAQGRQPFIPRSVSDYYDTTEWKAALEDFKQQTGMAMGGQPCYNCGGMYEHGGYYGNVPQHGNPGTYPGGYSGTSNGGQSFAFGGFLGDVSQGMRDGSLQALAGSILPMANIYQDKLSGSPIAGEMTKLGPDGKPLANSNLKNDLTKYLSNLTGEINKDDLQSIVSKYALGGMASQGYVPEYGSQSYGGFAYGGVPLREYNMGSGGAYYPDGGEVSPEDQAAMEMQQAQQSAPPQEGGAPDMGGGQIDPEQIIQAVGQMVQQGMQPQEIMQQLAQMGIPEDQAQQIIEAVMQQMQGGQEQGMQEQMMQEGQGVPMEEGMEQMMPPMQRYGGSYAYGGYNVTSQTTDAPVGINNLRKFTGQSMMEPSMEAMYEAAMQRPNVSNAGGYNDQVAQSYAQAAAEAAALNADHRRQQLYEQNRAQPYYNMDTNSGGVRKYPPVQMKMNQRTYAEGGMMGEEMDVTPEQMEYLRKQGYKFDII